MIARRPCSSPRLAPAASVLAILALASVPVEPLLAASNDLMPASSQIDVTDQSDTPTSPTATLRTGKTNVGGGPGRFGIGKAGAFERPGAGGGSDVSLQIREEGSLAEWPTSRREGSRRPVDDGNVSAEERAEIESGATRESSSGRWSVVAGSELVRALVEWGGRAGYAVVVERGSERWLETGFSRDGKMREALEDLIAGFATTTVPPVAPFNANDVMTIGACR